MLDVEKRLLDEVKRMMKEKGIRQSDYARSRGVGRQAVNPYFNGGRDLLTGMGADLLEWLDVDIVLVPRGGKGR